LPWQAFVFCHILQLCVEQDAIMLACAENDFSFIIINGGAFAHDIVA